MSGVAPPVGRPKTIEDATALADQRLAAADLSPRVSDGRLTNRQLVFAMADAVRKRVSDGEDGAKIAEILGSVTGDPLNRETMLSYLREENRAKSTLSPPDKEHVSQSKKGPIKPLRGPRTAKAGEKIKSTSPDRDTNPSPPATASASEATNAQASAAGEPAVNKPNPTPGFVR
jgi:hypothetical protein